MVNNNNYIPPSIAGNVRYNASSFEGTVQSDFMALGKIDENAKSELVDYSVADFDDFKEAFISYVKSVYPSEYNNFVQSDLGMVFMELFAYMGAVLSLKADFLANESYISTVKTPENLRKLLELIGVKMKGPIASKATATVTPDSTIPFSAGDTLQISRAQRTVTTTSQRDGTQLSYTLYKVNKASGRIDEASVAQAGALEIDYNSYWEGDHFEGLTLLEGQYQSVAGTFSTAQTQKRVRVPKASIIEGSLFVSSGDEVYNEIDSLSLASGSLDAVFEKIYNDDFSCSLLFGDDIRGKNPANSQSYVVYYRTGGGNRGDIVEGAIRTQVRGLKNGSIPVECTITNTSVAAGGANSETVAHAKKYAPYFFKSQYRAVTGEDYTAIANSFGGITGQTGKALAVARQTGAGGNMIDIYTLAKATDTQLQRASLGFKGDMLNYLNEFKMFTDELTIVDGLVRTVDLVVTVFVDMNKATVQENIKADISQRITSFLSYDNMDFGKPLRFPELTNYVMQNPDVRFLKVTNYDEDIYVNFNEIIQLNNFELNFEFV
tara:strand:+ start:3012 stop:4658 length:1647 start_codon:yes stop_codon:yes gene_type:complete